MCQPGGHTDSPSSVQSAALGQAGETYAADAQYSPLETQLQLNNLNSFLTGPNGYLSLYQNQIAPAAAASQAASNTAVRAGTVGDINALVPSMVTATRTANPQAASLVDTLTGTAASDLNYGVNLNPAETTQVQQAVRAGQAARGLGTGSSDALQEAFAQTDYGQQLYQQRRQNAAQAAGQAQSLYSGVIPTIAGGGANMGVAAGLSATGSGSVAPIVNPVTAPESAGQFASLSTQASLANSEERAQAVGKNFNYGSSM
jgi:hypothetical protein